MIWILGLGFLSFLIGRLFFSLPSFLPKWLFYWLVVFLIFILPGWVVGLYLVTSAS